ncbi:MAG: MFS transporter [Pseudonocardiaceae bacterium]
MLALGIGWALDSFEVQIIGSVLTPLANDFGVLGTDGAIAPWAVSLIWVVWFAGLMTGATAFGWLADRFGRKRLFVATLVMYSVATVISALSPTLGVFLVYRFITALGVGGEYSAVTSAIAEYMPTRRRGAATAATLNFWSIGGIAAGLIGIFFLNSLVAGRLALGGFTWSAWRLALLAGAVAAIYALIARRAIPESPRWLASQGRHADADAIITAISGLADDGSDLVGTPHRRSLTLHIGELWRHWRPRLAYGMVLEFSGSAAYYGLFTFLSAYVLVPAQVNVSSAAVPLFYLIGNLGALAGGCTVAALIDRLGRTTITRLSYGAASVSVLPGRHLGRLHAVRLLRDLFVDIRLHHLQRAVPDPAAGHRRRAVGGGRPAGRDGRSCGSVLCRGRARAALRVRHSRGVLRRRRHRRTAVGPRGWRRDPWLSPGRGRRVVGTCAASGVAVQKKTRLAAGLATPGGPGRDFSVRTNEERLGDVPLAAHCLSRRGVAQAPATCRSPPTPCCRRAGHLHPTPW